MYEWMNESIIQYMGGWRKKGRKWMDNVCESVLDKFLVVALFIHVLNIIYNLARGFSNTGQHPK